MTEVTSFKEYEIACAKEPAAADRITTQSIWAHTTDSHHGRRLESKKTLCGTQMHVYMLYTEKMHWYLEAVSSNWALHQALSSLALLGQPLSIPLAGAAQSEGMQLSTLTNITHPLQQGSIILTADANT